jgi:3-oxoacyl-[acyl-carrier protein] reductase
MVQTALITGASGDIGTAIAEALASKGYRLYLHYNQNEASVMSMQQRLNSEVIPVHADLSTMDGVGKLLSTIPNDIDSIIHNSGNSFVGLLTDMSDHEIERMTRLHITSPVLLTKRLLPGMIRRKSGHIIMITSVWGITGASCEVLYSTVKGGQNTFVKALAKEVAPSGIYVNGVAPGVISTKMMDDFTSDEHDMIKDEIPMGRFGTPQEVANVVSFLLSEKASYINGQVLSVNGGWYS